MSESFFGLPPEVRFCTKCVISNQRPRSTVEFQNTNQDKKETIEFDSQGVCEACRFHEEKEKGIDWVKREKELVDLCNRYRKPTGYDVIVPGSGGKDSAFTSHILKEKYGMNPLTVTWAPHLYTDIGWENFTNWIHVGGLDNILFTPNGRLHRYLTREAFNNLLHPFQPFIVGQRIIGPMLAQKFGIDLVMYGENQAEYGNAANENSSPVMQEKFFSTVDRSHIRLGGKRITEHLNDTNFSIEDFEPYLPLQLTSKIAKVHYLGYYLKWDPQECFYYAVENTGFKPNPLRTEGTYSKYSSIDDKIDPFHYCTTYIKFGLGRASYDAAQEVRNDKITREEAVSLVHQFDAEFPNIYFKDFLNYLSISEADFMNKIDEYRSPHLWSKGDAGNWNIKHAVWKEL